MFLPQPLSRHSNTLPRKHRQKVISKHEQFVPLSVLLGEHGIYYDFMRYCEEKRITSFKIGPDHYRYKKKFSWNWISRIVPVKLSVVAHNHFQHITCWSVAYLAVSENLVFWKRKSFVIWFSLNQLLENKYRICKTFIINNQTLRSSCGHLHVTFYKLLYPKCFTIAFERKLKHFLCPVVVVTDDTQNKWFEPRNHIITKLDTIVQVSVVPRRTVCDNIFSPYRATRQVWLLHRASF